jgi:hypothetical protein
MASMEPPAVKDTWAVIAVHGVGITSPGLTVEQLIATINKATPPPLVPFDPPEQRLLNPDEPPGNANPLQSRFPMHVRSATISGALNGSPKLAVFTEVFWADIRASSKGYWDVGGWSQIIVQVFTILFQLRYIAHQAATFPRLKSMYCLRWSAYLIWWLLSGPLAGVSAAIMFLIAAQTTMVICEAHLLPHGDNWVAKLYGTLGLERDSNVGPIVLITFAIALIAFAICVGQSGKRLSAKAMLRWAAPRAVAGGLFTGGIAWLISQNATEAKTLGLGATTCALGFLLFWRALEPSQKDGTWLLPLFCLGVCGLGITVLSLLRLVALVDGHGPVWLIDRLAHWWPREELESSTLNFSLALSLAVNMLTCWCLGFATFGAFLSWLGVLCQTRGRGKERIRSAATAALTSALLPVGIWVLIVPLLGMGTLLQFATEGYSQHLFDRTFCRFAFNCFLALWPVLTALMVYLVRKRRAKPWRERTVKSADPPPALAKPIPRLIASLWITGAILVATIVGFLVFIVAWFTGREVVYDEWFNGHAKTFSIVSGIVVLFVSLALGFVFLIDRENWLAVLHILNDIVGHFFRHRLRLSELWREPPPEMNWNSNYIEGFVIEMKLEKRFRLVLEELLRPKRVGRLTVIAHSQGTVIAFHCLCDPAIRKLVHNAGVSRVEFVTMGSPLSHLYQQYFPYRYPPLYRQDGKFDTISWREFEHFVDSWLNLYRVDDFIGTEIAGGTKSVGGRAQAFPKNQPVYGRGHIGYWTDDNAIRIARGFLPGLPEEEGFRQPNPQGTIDLSSKGPWFPVIPGEMSEEN